MDDPESDFTRWNYASFVVRNVHECEMMVSFAIIYFLQNWNSPNGMPFIENTSGMISKARNLKTRLRKKEYKNTARIPLQWLVDRLEELEWINFNV